jgi:hypothetical protein
MSSNSEYTIEEIRPLIAKYAEHRAGGFSKESFPDCDYRTIESHLNNNPDLQPEKELVLKAEREGRMEWEQIGKDLAKGTIQGNATSYIFNMKNRYGWADKQTIEQTNTHRITMTDDDGEQINPENTDL